VYGLLLSFLVEKRSSRPI